MAEPLVTPPDPTVPVDRFEAADPAEIVEWAARRFGEDLVVTASFEDAVLVDLVAQVAPRSRIVFLDTQYHFAETLWYVEELRRRFRLRLEIVRPAPNVIPDNQWQEDVESCCARRKVEPLARALAGQAAWMTGIRRADGPTRAGVPIVSWDPARSVVKVNPLARWSDEDVAAHQRARDLPLHPLTDRGYRSIGCWPCTRPVAPGEDRRAGRWTGLAKTECGLHIEERP